MRHGNKINNLGRTAPHRKAMLSNMASSLILHKRITTTVAKAKALRKYVEPLITKSKSDSTHSRRVVFSYLQSKESVKELFDEVSEKISARPGGYTRIIKTGTRLGDNAEMCIIELVDYNELLLGGSDAKKAKTRRSRRGSSKKSEETKTAVEPKAAKEEKVETKEAAVEESAESVESPVEAKAEDVVEAKSEEPEVSADSEEKTDESDSEEQTSKNE